MKPSLYKYRKMQQLAAQPAAPDLASLSKGPSLSIGKAPLNSKEALASRKGNRNQTKYTEENETGGAKDPFLQSMIQEKSQPSQGQANAGMAEASHISGQTQDLNMMTADGTLSNEERRAESPNKSHLVQITTQKESSGQKSRKAPARQQDSKQTMYQMQLNTAEKIVKSPQSFVAQPNAADFPHIHPMTATISRVNRVTSFGGDAIPDTPQIGTLFGVQKQLSDQQRKSVTSHKSKRGYKTQENNSKTGFVDG